MALPSTRGGTVDLGRLPPGRAVIFCYPRTGRPGEPLPDGWDEIPGARGCTPQACGFRDRYLELAARGIAVYGLSTQDPAYQREMAERLRLPYPVLSDAGLAVTDALGLPTFEAAGMRLLKRLTLIVRDGMIEHVLYPVFPPDQSAAAVIDWLGAR